MNLLIGSVSGAIKRSPNVLGKWFQPDSFYFANTLEDSKLNEVDVFIQTNLLKLKFFNSSKLDYYKFIAQSNKPKLVLESPMFRSVSRNSHKIGLLRLGWNSYQYHEGDFNNKNSDQKRWRFLQEKYKINRCDWKVNGEYILLLLQKPGDSSLNSIHLELGYKKYWDWVDDTVSEIRKRSDRKIIIRPHINGQKNSIERCSKISKKYKNCSVSKNYKWIPDYGPCGGSGLQKDLEDAWCAITYNSLSGVEAVLSGTPLITLHQGSMCWPVAHHSLDNIENLDRSINIDQWLYDSAYTTWTHEEFLSGKVWEHLKPRYEYWKNQAVISTNKFNKELEQWKNLLQ